MKIHKLKFKYLGPILLIVLIFGCSKEPPEKTALFDVEEKIKFSNIEKQGYKSVPENLLLYEKKIDDVTLYLDVDLHLKEVYLKIWTFKLQGNSLSEAQCKEILKPYNLQWIAPFAHADSTFAIFCVRNQQNRTFLCKNIVENDSSRLEVEYYFPIELPNR